MKMKKKKSAILVFFEKSLFFLIVLLLPTQFGKYFFPSFSFIDGIRVDYLAVKLYLIDFLVGALFILNLKTVVRFLLNKSIFIFLILLLPNIYFADSRILAFLGAVRWFEFLVLFILVKTKGKVIGSRDLLSGFLLSGAVQLGLSIIQFVTKQSVQGPFYFIGERLLSLGTPGVAKTVLNGVELMRPYGTFSHPNSMAGFYLLTYFFVLTYRKFDRFFVLKQIALFVFSCLVFISFSRNAIGIFVFFNVVHLFCNEKKCGICLFGRIVSLVMLSLVFFSASKDPASISKRLMLIKDSVMIIRDNLVFGTGINNYLLAQAEFPSRFPFFINQPVHNIFLLFISEAGVLITAAVVFYCRLLIQTIFKNGMIFLLGVVLISGMFDHYWMTLIQNFLLIAVVFSFKAFQDRA